MRKHWPITIEKFLNENALIPSIVGQTVALRNGASDENAQAFARYTESRMIAVYNRNKAFRRRMNGPHSREWLYVFAEHWYKAWAIQMAKRPKGINVDELFGKE